MVHHRTNEGMHVCDKQGEAGNLPSSWQYSAILQFHFCPKPVENKSKMCWNHYYFLITINGGGKTALE